MGEWPWPYWVFLSALALGGVLGVGALFGGHASHLDAHGDVDVHGHLEGHGDADGDDAEGTLSAWLSLFGVGRVPLGVLLTLNLLLFGGFGIVVSEVLHSLLPFSAAALVALPVAVIASPVVVAKFARVIARRLPGVESHGATRSDLVGRLGRAELRIDTRFGRAKVVDQGGALHQVRCVTRGVPLEAGTEIVITDIHPDTGIYVAERVDVWLDSNLAAERETREEA